MGLFISVLLVLTGMCDVAEAMKRNDNDGIVFGTFDFTIGVVAIVFFLWKLLA